MGEGRIYVGETITSIYILRRREQRRGGWGGWCDGAPPVVFGRHSWGPRPRSTAVVFTHDYFLPKRCKY